MRRIRLKKGIGSELAIVNAVKNHGCEAPVPLFQRLLDRTVGPLGRTTIDIARRSQGVALGWADRGPFGATRKALHSPLSTLHSPRGISLLEVLISVFILSIGLLGVASLIPLGKLAMIETNKSDRTGACGRAALSDVRVRRMLDMSFDAGTPAYGNLIDPFYAANDATEPLGRVDNCAVARIPFVIDPLGVVNGLGGSTNGLGMNLGGTRVLPNPPTNFSIYFPLPRFTLNWATPVLADQVFRWSDELTFDMPTDAMLRPRGFAVDNQNRTVAYPVLPSDPIQTPPATAWTPLNANLGNFSWFLTATPTLQPGAYSVSIVVCNPREFGTTTPGVPATNQPIEERTVDVMGISGGTIQLPPQTIDVNGVVVNLNSKTFPLKKDQWVMLLGWELDGSNRRIPRDCKWYRVVGIGTDVVTTPPYLSIDGPDWDFARFNIPNTAGTTMVVVDGACGVYTTTMRLDQL